MKEELAQIDLELKGLFVDNKLEELIDFLKDQPAEIVKEISDYNWNIIKKYYDTENFELLFTHLKFVAFSCFMVEYAHQIGLISEEAFSIMMMIYNDIYELKRKQ